MPEIAGDAAILVDPFSEQSIAEGMIKCMLQKLRDSLIEKEGFAGKLSAGIKPQKHYGQVLKNNILLTEYNSDEEGKSQIAFLFQTELTEAGL